MPTLLDAALVGDALSRLAGWTGDGGGIRRTLSMTDTEYGDFIERVKVTSDAMDHHADISRNGDEVSIALVTHSAGGVTEYDIALASRINDLARIAKNQPQPPLPPEAFGRAGEVDQNADV
jgi:4a-hydroxytetrahydrobiopterin dehydratase